MKSTVLSILAFVLISIGYAQEPIGKPQVVTENQNHGCVYGNCNDGWGQWKYDNGYYDGFWFNGKRNGYGLYEWDDVGTYIGFWVDDNMEGYGSYETKSGEIMKGMFHNGQLDGLGEVYNENKEWVLGLYKANNIQTQYSFFENSVNTGCIAGNCQDKYGEYVWSNGDEFLGFFMNGKPYLGKYTFSNKDAYYGTFNSQGQFDGQGRFFYSAGGYYGGGFRNGNLDGRGYYHNKDYETQIGIWESGKLIKSLQD